MIDIYQYKDDTPNQFRFCINEKEDYDFDFHTHNIGPYGVYLNEEFLTIELYVKSSFIRNIKSCLDNNNSPKRIFLKLNYYSKKDKRFINGLYHNPGCGLYPFDKYKILLKREMVKNHKDLPEDFKGMDMRTIKGDFEISIKEGYIDKEKEEHEKFLLDEEKRKEEEKKEKEEWQKEDEIRDLEAFKHNLLFSVDRISGLVSATFCIAFIFLLMKIFGN